MGSKQEGTAFWNNGGKYPQNLTRYLFLRERNLQALSKIFETPLSASSCLSVRPSVRMQQLISNWTNFHETFSCVLFENLQRKFKFHLNMTRATRALNKNLCPSVTSRSAILRMRNFSHEICRGNQNTHLCSIIFFFRKLCHVRGNGEKYCGAGQATDDNMAIAHCMLDT